ncbi:MAG: GTP-binding protein [Bacillales bacterium]|nr:GTP-binding protein [Bacillales bacterium]
MLKIDVISGFLGAGKTTLIKKMFDSNRIKNEKVVIIENEFGEIGIDGSFLKDSGIQIKEINAGCICCSLVGDFEKSIKEIIDVYSPDRIIIEPSGVGKLSDIIEAVKNVGLEEIKINILATVVDGGKVKMYLKNFGEFFKDQVNSADTIIVAKVDKISEEKLVESVSLVKEVNAKANIITTNIASLDPDKLISYLEEKASMRDEFIAEVEEEHHHHHHDENEECCCGHHHHHHDEDEECCCGHHHEDEECDCHHEHHHHHHDEDEECCCGHHRHHHEDEECECHHEHHHHHDEDEECCCGHHHHHHGHDADEVFVSWGIETPRSFTYDELDSFLKTLCDEDAGLGMILRSKGIVRASDNDKWYYFDLVAGDYEIRTGEPDYTGRVVVIGSKLDEDKISSLFNKKAM